MATFLVGPAAKRELRRALVKSTNPAETISNFQSTRSLHSMFARAFGTVPEYDAEAAGNKDGGGKDEKPAVESLDTDSVLLFLSHLGVGQHEVHKRIADSLQKQLEDEIRKTSSQEPLLNLLKSCWPYATTLPELRPVLWAVLKQLGSQTPLQVLTALAEREKDGITLKHADIFRPLPPLLKRLVWEADWDSRVSLEKEQKIDNPLEYLELVEATMLSQTVAPLVEEYCSNAILVESVNHPFVSSARERRLLTTQRRALVSAVASGVTVATATGVASSMTTALANKAATTTSGVSATPTNKAASSTDSTVLSTGKAVSQLRELLGDTTGGTTSYQPKLLHAILSMLMAKHGAIIVVGKEGRVGTNKEASSSSSTTTSAAAATMNTLVGPHLHCTLVADILLSAGGPLPKAYQHVLTLARILDDAVKVGNLSDQDIIKIQAVLKLIYEPDENEKDEKIETGDKDKGVDGKDKEDDKKKSSPSKPSSSVPPDSPTKTKLEEPKQVTTFLKRQLNRIVTAGLVAMKESDPQSLFLNPVTDAIAPGYSKVITNPMCISTMEDKIDKSEYNAIAEWEADVKLMFQNCIEYNKGTAGQWFRGEAKRQHKVYKDEVLPQARKLYQIEVARRNPDEELANKRKREIEAKQQQQQQKPRDIQPLPSAQKRRKKETQEQTPSMPALASMLLADPFVVRILLDRVLRNLRVDVLKGSFVPAAHAVVPSLLQLLHVAQWSTQLCAVGGRRYLIPDGGLSMPDATNTSATVATETKEMVVPYESLRRCMPIVMHLLLESELDRRLVLGGDLNPVAQALEEEGGDDGHIRPTPPTIFKREKGSPPLHVAVSLLEYGFYFVCLPGNSQDSSLSMTFPKFAKALGRLAANVCEERPFFRCLVPAILRHKARLPRVTRDVIVSTWIDWLRGSKKKNKAKSSGSMTSAAHEYLVYLLTEWANMGNLVMPRDLLLSVSSELVEAVDSSEPKEKRKFAKVWQSCTKRDDPMNEAYAVAFEPIKNQYERMLILLPETHRTKWKERVGIVEAAAENSEAAEATPDVKSPTKEPLPPVEGEDPMEMD
jgi:hypothetical protein